MAVRDELFITGRCLINVFGKQNCIFSCSLSKSDQLQQRVAAKPVGAMHLGIAALSSRKASLDPFNLQRALDIDTSHTVVRDRLDRYECGSGIDPFMELAQMYLLGEELHQLLNSEMSDIQKDLFATDYLLINRPRYDISRQEFIHEAFAFAVEQVSPLSSSAFRDEDGRIFERRGVKLDKFYI